MGDVLLIGPNPVDLILPVTVSPTWKVPEFILISSNFGVINALTSTLSKNG